MLTAVVNTTHKYNAVSCQTLFLLCNVIAEKMLVPPVIFDTRSGILIALNLKCQLDGVCGIKMSKDLLSDAI